MRRAFSTRALEHFELDSAYLQHVLLVSPLPSFRLFALQHCPISSILMNTSREEKPIEEVAGAQSQTDSPKSHLRRTRVSLLHSDPYTKILESAMKYINQDRDILLAALLDYCGFLERPPKFFSVIAPKRASRRHLERFHAPHYLDLLEFQAKDEHGDEEEQVKPLPSHDLLENMGLTDDCPLPEDPSARAMLWTYCRHVAGASLQAAKLLSTDQTDVAIHWGGGRHHAHAAHAGGFCYINDVVLALQYLQQQSVKTLYLDIDIHHSDGVQRAFYDTDQVLTVSFHRYTAGFFPYPSGSIKEKGKHMTSGVGHNLNLPLPTGVTDAAFCSLYRYVLTNLCDAYNPQAVVLCTGADGLQGDPLVASTDLGWNLSPEGIAECVRFAAEHCGASKRKLMVLGAGGYNPVATARTFLLCTAAACEGARPGMLWNELPKDVPRHVHFERYGPDFRLVEIQRRPSETEESSGCDSLSVEARKAVDLTVLNLQAERNKRAAFQASDGQDWWKTAIPKKVRSSNSAARSNPNANREDSDMAVETVDDSNGVLRRRRRRRNTGAKKTFQMDENEKARNKW
jgi:histone deacetylase 8